MANAPIWRIASLAFVSVCAANIMSLPLRAAEQKLALPGTSFAMTISPAEQRPNFIDAELVRDLTTWLSNKFSLSTAPEPPAIKFESAEALLALSLRTAHSLGDIIAMYSDANRTIYLPLGWSGRTRAELSILVHELVHHLQNVSGQRFDCPENREKLAYEAQAEFLTMLGGSMSADFGIDGFTLLVRTACFY